MADFSARARAALAEKGISMRRAARALSYDPAQLSRVLSGKQQPSPKLAGGLDRLTDAGGVLIALVPRSPSLQPWAAGDEGDDLEALELAQ